MRGVVVVTRYNFKRLAEQRAVEAARAARSRARSAARRELISAR
jgi:hypothetical protein